MGSSIYEAHAVSVYEAKADIRRLKDRFTLFNFLGEPPAEGESGSWEPWLVPVQAEVSARNPAIEHHRSLGNTARVESAEQARSAEVKQYNIAIENFQKSLPKLRELESSGELFCAVDKAANEFRYIVDEGVKKYYWMEQRGLAGLAEDELELANYTTHFLGPKRIGLTENETDAVRIQANNVVLRSIEIVDERGQEDIAHRDGVQLIPPGSADEGGILSDRMAGSVMSDIHIDNCTINAPSAKLQGIFSSDGFCRNLTISNNTIKTAAGHFISVAGVLDGCRIANNTLQQVSDIAPQIKLFPGRLGGNMADDGVVYVLSFAAGSEQSYGEVECVDNQYIGLNEQVLADQFSDERDQIPAGYGQISLGLRNFNYQGYMDTYSQWTVADYKANDSVGFRRLRAWLEQRIEEYETGERIDIAQEGSPILSPPTVEQKTSVVHVLREGLTLLDDATEAFLSTRIADLHSMPIRSFIIKRLATREGDIVLGPLDAYVAESRYAQIKWFLEKELPVDKEVTLPAIQLSQQLEKNYGELKIMALPLEVEQGQAITFSVNESEYLQSGDQASYYWMVKGQAGNNSKFELDTSEWSLGEHNVRATLYVRPASGGAVTPIPGSALFRVKAPIVAVPEKPKTEKPLHAFGDLREHIQVNHAKCTSGEKLLVSLDSAFIDEQSQGANLRYYWSAQSYPASQGVNYEVDTTGFESGEFLVRMTMYRTDLETNESQQYSGVAVVEVLEREAVG